MNHLSHLVRRVAARHTAAAAYVALLLASSTAVYAAATIGSPEVIDNSLQSVDLKDGAAVKGADIVNDSVAGADVNEATLTGVGRKFIYNATPNPLAPKTTLGTVGGYTFKATCSFTPMLFTRLYVNGPAGGYRELMTVAYNDSSNNATARASGDAIAASTDKQILYGGAYSQDYERVSGDIWIRSGGTLLKIDVHLLTDARNAGACSLYLMVTRGV